MTTPADAPTPKPWRLVVGTPDGYEIDLEYGDQESLERAIRALSVATKGRGGIRTFMPHFASSVRDRLLAGAPTESPARAEACRAPGLADARRALGG